MPRREAVHTQGLPSAHLAFTDATVGDLRVSEPGVPDPDPLRDLRQRVAPHPWTWLRQVHGNRVVEVDGPGEFVGTDADAAVTTELGVVLAVHTADCAPVLLIGDGADPVTGDPVRVIGAAHAGWKGLRDGVIDSTVALMRRLGASEFMWDLGPCISPAAYAFDEAELDGLCEQLGPTLRSTTLDGAPALDLRAGVRASLERNDINVADGASAAVPCTALDAGFYSWRARKDSARQAAVIWLAPDDHDYPWHR